MIRRIRLLQTIGLIGGACIPLGFGNAQDLQDPGGFVLTLDVGSTFRTDSNFELRSPSQGSSSFMTHTFGLELSSQTRSQSFVAGLGGSYRYGHIAGLNTPEGFDAPSAYVRYSREASNSALTFGASADESKIQFLRLEDGFDDDLDNQDLIVDNGSLATYRVNSSLEIGKSAAFGLRVDGSFDRRDYTDTTNPGLYDSETLQASVTGILRFSPTLTGRVVTKWRDYSAKDALATDRDTVQVGFELDGDITPSLHFTSAIYHNSIETTETVGGLRTPRSNTGLSGHFALTQDLANGTAGVRVQRDFSTNDGRTALTIERDLEWARSTVSASLGISNGDVGGTHPVGALSFSHQLKRGRITAQLNRAVQTSNNEDLLQITKGSLGYAHELSDISTLSFNYSYAQSKNIGPSAVIDQTRQNFTITYNRDLVQDWVMSSGLEMRQSDTSTAPSAAKSNGMFLSLNKRFTFRP